MYINLSPKDHAEFSIINNYDVLYRYFIEFDDIIDDEIIHNLTYLDLKKYELKINEVMLIKKLTYRFYQIIIDNYGLYYPDGSGRGKLIIDVNDPQGILETLNKVKGKNIFTLTKLN